MKNLMLMPAAYNQQQSTKPQTLGYALNDSPAGLLAWIVEKFRTWSDSRHTQGQLPFSKDFLITNACLYWLTGNVTSSFRIYYEALHTGDRDTIISKLYCKVRHGWLTDAKSMVYHTPLSSMTIYCYVLNDIAQQRTHEI